MIWEENFSEGTLNNKYWNLDLGYFHTPGDANSYGWGNRELQYYTDSNYCIRDGCLQIKATREPQVFPEGHTANYASARLTTRGKFSYTHGRIDVTARMPVGTGLWPAIWLLPEENQFGPWPASGEIDIAECRGRVPDRIQGTLHFGRDLQDHQHLSGEYIFPTGQNVGSAFHTYSLIRRPDALFWLVNDELFFSLSEADWSGHSAGTSKAIFDQPFYLILNLAVGGAYDDDKIPEPENIPAVMMINSIRVSSEE